MTTSFRIAIVAAGITVGLPAAADSTLEYVVAQTPGQPPKAQPVLVKDGRVMVKGAGGDSRLDLLYSRAGESLFVIDHRKHSVMTLDRQELSRIGRQIEQFQPLLQGVGEQLGRLSPEQRARWEQMLGGSISLEQVAEAAKPAQSARIVKAGAPRSVAGVSCEPMSLVQGNAKTAEFCLADPGRLNLPGDDYATLRALLHFSEQLAVSTQGLAGHFGISLPNVQIHDLAGVPVEVKDLSGHVTTTVTLNRIVSSALDDELLQVPAGYRPEPLAPWQ